MVQPDGAVRFLHAHAKVVYDRAGHAEYLFGIAQDITERKSIDIALHESDQYRHRLIEEALIGLALTRLDGSFIEVNSAFARMLRNNFV